MMVIRSERRAFDRTLALFLLNGGFDLTRKAGSFLGQVVVDESELTEKQAQWLDALAEKHEAWACLVDAGA